MTGGTRLHLRLGVAASRRLSKGKSTERTNVHQDVTPETLTGGLGVTMDTITAILSCVKTPDLLTTLRIWATTCVENVLIRTTTASRVVSCVKKTFYYARDEGKLSKFLLIHELVTRFCVSWKSHRNGTPGKTT